MKMMTMMRSGLVLAVLAAAAVTGVSVAPVAAAEAQAKSTATTKGVIKTFDDAAVVIIPSDNKKVEVTFQVSPATTKTGAVAAGDQVSISYYFEAGKRVAAAVNGKVAK